MFSLWTAKVSKNLKEVREMNEIWLAPLICSAVLMVVPFFAFLLCLYRGVVAEIKERREIEKEV